MRIQQLEGFLRDCATNLTPITADDLLGKFGISEERAGQIAGIIRRYQESEAKRRREAVDAIVKEALI